MDPLFIVVVIAVLAALIGWWQLRRRRQAPVEDEWTLPPEAGSRPAPPAVPQRLDRDALVNPNRRLDPTRWDNSPEGSAAATGEDEPGDLPRFFDREYLNRQDRRTAEEPGTTEPEDDANRG